jgi:hypothetical protein
MMDECCASNLKPRGWRDTPCPGQLAPAAGAQPRSSIYSVVRAAVPEAARWTRPDVVAARLVNGVDRMPILKNEKDNDSEWNEREQSQPRVSPLPSHEVPRSPHDKSRGANLQGETHRVVEDEEPKQRDAEQPASDTYDRWLPVRAKHGSAVLYIGIQPLNTTFVYSRRAPGEAVAV